MAMTLCDTMDRNMVDMKILATDIAASVLEKCRSGVYEKKKLEPVPLTIRDRYFKKNQNGNMY